MSLYRYAAFGILITIASLLIAQDGSSDRGVRPHLGFDLSSRDLTVRPSDDFNRYASGHWRDMTIIPADRQSDGSKERVYLETQATLRSIVQADAGASNSTGDTARIGRLYASFMDEDTTEQLGVTPLARDLAAIRAASDHDAVAALMGRSFGGVGASLFRIDVYEDLKNPNLSAPPKPPFVHLRHSRLQSRHSTC